MVFLLKMLLDKKSIVYKGMFPSRSGTGDQIQMAEKMTQTDLFHNGVKVKFNLA